MEFLALIMALSLQQLVPPGNLLQRDGWLLAWERQVCRHVDAGLPRLLGVLGGVALLLTFLLSLLDGWLFALPELLASAAVLFWSLGREDYHSAVERHAARQKGVSGAADVAACDLWLPPSSTAAAGAQGAYRQGAAARGRPAGDNASELSAVERIAYAGYARWFAPVFWFVLTGPLGAALYRTLAVLAASGQWRDYGRLLQLADWLPARLLALSFALVGDFAAVSRRAPLSHFFDSEPASQLITELAICASDGQAKVRPIADLLYRSAGLWLLVVCGLLLFA